MDRERQRRIEALYQAALSLDARERPGFLDAACSNDRELRAAIESRFAESAEDATRVVVPAGAPPRYQISGFLGAGGMGKVYKARDTRLGRDVALKICRQDLSDGLEREARTIASLNHPHICTVFDVGPNYLVMELVEGPTLAERIRTGPLPAESVIRFGIQIAGAVAAAHAHGIIHRDLKPGNIMLTGNGVKVLDFGLAKMMTHPEAGEDVDDRTSQDVLRGTPAYMSPEQARGEPLDERSDVFSMGSVLYAAATGRAPFGGGSTLSILNQIVSAEPVIRPSATHPGVPPELDAVLLRALAKATEERYGSAAELAQALEALSGVAPARSDSTQPPARKSLLRRLSVLFAAGALILVAVAAGIRLASLRELRPPPAAMRWYDEGTRALGDGAYFTAMKAFERAVDLDRGFSLAHARLAEAAAELNYMDKAKSEMLQASPLAASPSRLSSVDRVRLEAVYLVVIRDFPGAIKEYQQLRDVVPEAEKAAALVDLGRAFEAAARPADAIATYSESIHHDPQYAAAFLRRGSIYGRQQQLDKAAADFDAAEQLYRIEQRTEGLTEVLYQRWLVLRRAGRLLEGKPLMGEALRLSRAVGDDYHQIRALLALSFIEYNQGDTAGGQQQAEQAVDLARAAGVEPLAASGLVDIGNALYYQGDNAGAERYLRTAAALSERYHADLVDARASVGLSQVLIKQGRVDEALAISKQAVAFYERGGFRGEAARALIPVGRAMRDKGEFEAASTLFEQQIPLAEQAHDQLGVALAQIGVGSVMMQQEKYPAALARFDLAVAAYRVVGDELGLGYSLADRAEALANLGRFQEASAALEDAERYASRQGGNQPLLAEVHLTRAKSFLAQLRFADAAKEIAVVSPAVAQDTAQAADANMVLGQDRADSGAVAEGVRLCRLALRLAEKSGDAALPDRARLALAGALMGGGNRSEALGIAAGLSERFGAGKLFASEWRADLIAAHSAPSVAERRKYTSAAAAALDNLRKSWGEEAFATYLARPDVRLLRH
jgi:tetratricopeptide (TPR) repeat protein/tRNA A-37 threonylcarbamoyl transferase component Bud32